MTQGPEHPLQEAASGPSTGDPLDAPPGELDAALLDGLTGLKKALRTHRSETPAAPGADLLAQLSAMLEERRRLSKLLARSENAVRRAAALADDDVLRLAHAVLEHAETPGVPLKRWARSVEDPAARGVLLRALDERRFAALGDVAASGVVGWERPLPRSAQIGAGLDERVLELSLACEHLLPERPGRALDAGAALNAPDARRVLRGTAVHVTYFTQSGEREPAEFDGPRASYVFGDLRELPFRDGWFDRVACVSTLEHVGMDNSRYGGPPEHDPESALRALEELVRVLAPGGSILLTVPFGVAADHGWYRVFGPRDVEQLERRLRRLRVERRTFRYDGCWCDGEPGREDVPGLLALRATRGR